MIDFPGLDVLVVGLGDSGASASTVLLKLGSRVVLVDASASPARADLADGLKRLGIDVRLGVSVPEDVSRFKLVVASPGVPDGADVLEWARRARIKVISELELGYRLLDNEIVAVTGTNGKTTTTSLVARMLEGGGRPAVVCGNIGNPIVGLYGKVREEDILVVEVSSFQLQNIEEFRAGVAVVLNLAPDHFDWHPDFEHYEAAKARIVENQSPEDTLVYNADDPFCVGLAGRTRGRTAGFGVEPSGELSVWLQDGWITAGPPLSDRGRVMPVEEIQVEGVHNLMNVMAATGAALAAGGDVESIRKVASEFTGLEHRMEFVCEVGGVSFYNDSKATNPHAALHAIRSFEGPTVLIMGGRNKGLDFDELAAEVCGRLGDGRVSGVVLFGESAGEIRRALEGRCGAGEMGRITLEGTLDGSIDRAVDLSGDRGAVLFTPGCASFDMFKDYADRGRAFKSYVNELTS